MAGIVWYFLDFEVAVIVLVIYGLVLEIFSIVTKNKSRFFIIY